MKKSRLVRFVGGPLHGESREGPDSETEFLISKEAASALRKEISKGGMPPASIETAEEFRYVKRDDGRYWLAIMPPDSLQEPPPGFTMHWFDAGEDRNLVEIHAPPSDWGHAYTEVHVSDELLGDAIVMEREGITLIMEMALDSLEASEGALVRGMGSETILALAERILGRDPETETPGNRRIVAALLKDLVELRPKN